MLTLISLNSFLQGWLSRLAVYVSSASKALAAFSPEKSGTHRTLSDITSDMSGLQNLRSCGTTHR